MRTGANNSGWTVCAVEGLRVKVGGGVRVEGWMESWSNWESEKERVGVCENET